MEIGKPLRRVTIIPVREKIAPSREPEAKPVPERRVTPQPALEPTDG